MDKIILVMAGGSLGALARYALTIYISQLWGTRFPWGTLVINLTGCFLIGLGFALGQERHILSPATQLLFMTGFLGAYTTFSTYGLETINFARAGQSGIALVNVLASNLGGLLLVVVGLWVGRMLFAEV